MGGDCELYFSFKPPTPNFPRFPRQGGPPIKRAYDVKHDL